jgi:uncharacterized RDD family membrane protein YckC
MSSEKIIEPTEIILDQEEEHASYTHVSPWNRFLARMFDYTLLEILLFFFFTFVFPSIHREMLAKFIPIQFLLWVPIESFLLYTWGYTPGKFLFNTKLKKKLGGKLDFYTALRRSFSVWFRGLGLGIPIVNIFAMFFSFSSLKTQGITAWDREENITITHHPISRFRLAFGCAIIVVGVFLFIH